MNFKVLDLRRDQFIAELIVYFLLASAPNSTAERDRHVGVSNLPKVVT